MSLKFGSGQKKRPQIQVLKTTAKRVTVEVVAEKDKAIEILKEPLIEPVDYVTSRKLIDQFQKLREMLPVIVPNEENLPLLVKKRKELIILMIRPFPIMTKANYIPEDSEKADLVLFRVDIMTFKILLAVSRLCSLVKLPDYRPRDFKELEAMGLIGVDYADTPFSAMTLLEVFSCIGTLQQSWKDIVYSSELGLILDAILLRISEFVCSPIDREMFADCGSYLEVMSDGAIYLNETFLQDFGWVFIDMLRSIAIQSHLGSVVRPPPIEFTKRDRQWLWTNARTIEQSEDFQTKVMEIVLRHNCYLGEFERFIRDHKKERFARTPRFKKLISARGPRGKATAAKLMESLTKSLPTDVMHKNSGFSKTCRDEVFLLCMVHWIQQYIQVDFERNFIRIAPHFIDNFEAMHGLVLAQGYPVIVQSFNRFNVHYREILYMTNSLRKATLLFFAFVMRDHKGMVLNTPIDGLRLHLRDMRHFWEIKE